MSVLREAIIYNMGTVQRITKCWWMGSFGHRGVTHHHFVLRFLTNLNGYRKREAANGHAGCSFKRCSDVHFIPKVMTIHWETMTSVMAVFSRWVGRETELENELIMRERERERERKREREAKMCLRGCGGVITLWAMARCLWRFMANSKIYAWVSILCVHMIISPPRSLHVNI